MHMRAGSPTSSASFPTRLPLLLRLTLPPRPQPPPPASRSNEDPFEADEARKAESDAVFGKENTGINFDAYEDIPVETSGHDVPAHVETFEELDLGDALLANIRRCKYTKPTPVQKYAIPIGLAGRDMMACAQTGSGKTAAFCFPIIAGLLKSGYQPTGRQRKVRRRRCWCWGAVQVLSEFSAALRSSCLRRAVSSRAPATG
jgi:hypothetical protein